jgi:recombination protein RecA
MSFPAPVSPRHQAFAELKAGLDARHRQTLIARFTQDDPSVIRTSFEAFDQALGGGFARGTIATLEGPASSGRTAIAARLLAGATRCGLAAAVDDGSLYPPALAQAGVRLDRLLFMPAADPVGIARATDILLRSHAFGVVVMPAVAVKAAVWTRLAGLAHHANALLVAVGAQAGTELGYFASARVQCRLARVLWTNASGPFCELGGYDIHAQIIKNKRSAPGTSAVIRVLAKAGGVLRERSLEVSQHAFVPQRSVIPLASGIA